MDDSRSDTAHPNIARLMRCTICKLEMREPDRSTERAVCEKCLEATIHLKQTAGKPKQRLATSSHASKVSLSTPLPQSTAGSALVKKEKSNLETIKSARALARAWRQQNQNALEQSGDSGRKFRIDSAHSADSDSSQVNKAQSLPKFISIEPQATSIASVRNAISFGLFVFLLGQALMLGAFLVSHLGAWAVGMLLSIGGITVSLISVNEALHRLDRRLQPNSERKSRGKTSRSRVSG